MFYARMASQGRIIIAGALLSVGVSGICRGQAVSAPAPPSYSSIVRTIDAVRDGWKTNPPEAAVGWNAYFDTIQKEIDAYNAAKSAGDRLGPLNRLWHLSTGLEGVVWDPAVELREGLRSWLRPRVRLANAEQRLTEALGQNVTSPDDAKNRKDWNTFIDAKLGVAVKEYEGAKSVQSRQEAIKKLRASLKSLRETNPWSYSAELQAAANDLFNGPNLDISADTASLFPVLATEIITSGPVYRRGYISQVTAGAYAGFRLTPSDEGISFTNSQYLTSVTPITDFNQQMASDPRGKRAAKLYSFSAISTDSGYVTATATITPNGLVLAQAPAHHFDAQICATPAEGGGMQRLIASAIGMNKKRITNKVYQGAIGPLRQNAEQEAADESAERLSAARVEQNAKIRKFLPGDGSLTINDITIAGLSLRSTPVNALAGGILRWGSHPDDGGADVPQPPKFAQPASGVSADIHLTSVANNLIAGFLSSPKSASVESLVIEVKKPVAGAPVSDSVKISNNVPFAEYLKKLDAAAATGDPDNQVIRVKKPKRPPELAVDVQGRLILIVHDLQLDLPVPPQVAKSGLGSPAKVYRLSAPVAEFAFEIKPVTEPNGSIKFVGQLKELIPGPGAKVFAINDDEAKALPLDRFRSIVIFQGFASALKLKPINIPLENVKLRGYNIASISELDPSGWMRIVLTPTGERPFGPAAGAGG